MHDLSKCHEWLNQLVDSMLRYVINELEVVDVVTTECMNRLELCCKLMAHEVKDLALLEKQSWAVRLTEYGDLVLDFSRGGTKFMHVVQALCDGGTSANLHPVCIKHALKDMKDMLPDNGLACELHEGIESAHVIHNLGTPLFK